MYNRGRSDDYSNCFAGINPISNPSVASDLVLVIELTAMDGKHYCSVLMEPSKVQYYDVKRSDRHPHFHILGTMQFGSYVTRLREKCAGDGLPQFELLTEEEVRSGHRPDRCIIILRGDKDYELDEVVVWNNLHLHPVLRKVVTRFPATWYANILFGDEHIGGGVKDKNSRGNRRLDAGYTGTNSTDKKTVPGMNLPGRITKQSKYPGLGSDATREMTIFRSGCLVMCVHDYVRSNMSGECQMSENTFNDPAWWHRYTYRWGQDLGLLRDPAIRSYARFTGTSVLGAGVDVDNNLIKTDKHVDNSNCIDDGHDHSPTIMFLVEANLGDGSSAEVRIGQNVYDKHECGLALKKERVNKEISMEVGLLLTNQPLETMAVHNLYQKFTGCKTRLEGLMVDLDYEVTGNEMEAWVYPEDVDKDGYYSLIVNVILDISSTYGWSKWLMMEIVLTLTLNPCPLRWAIACYKAARLMARGGRSTSACGRRVSRNTNFFCCFVAVQVDEFGTVSGGGMYRRCQVSHPAQYTRNDIWTSLVNMNNCISEANEEGSDTKKLVSKLTSKPEDGGCVGVGLFWAQAIINVLVKLKLIVQTCHANRPVIATSTTTYKRLLSEGVMNPTHARDLIGWLSNELDAPMDKCENAVCQYLRAKYGHSGTYDCFIRGHKLYKIVCDEVMVYDAGGRRMVNARHQPTVGTYTATCKWWVGDREVGKSVLYLKTTKKKKKK